MKIASKVRTRRDKAKIERIRQPWLWLRSPQKLKGAPESWIAIWRTAVTRLGDSKVPGETAAPPEGEAVAGSEETVRAGYSVTVTAIWMV